MLPVLRPRRTTAVGHLRPLPPNLTFTVKELLEVAVPKWTALRNGHLSYATKDKEKEDILRDKNCQLSKTLRN